jgi:hypothetical protein
MLKEYFHWHLHVQGLSSIERMSGNALIIFKSCSVDVSGSLRLTAVGTAAVTKL